MRPRDSDGTFDDSNAALDLSITGDEEEQHRIELEHNLQDLSIQLSLSNQSQGSDREHSVEQRDSRHMQVESSLEIEYPRHVSRHRDVSIFRGQNSSFLDNTELGQDHDPDYNSYRSAAADDDAEVHYTGNTMSTAAHHASMVTLSAGLGGRSGKSVYVAESSLSGAEFDRDRPLDSVLNGVADELSMLDMDNTLTRRKRAARNAFNAHAQVTFDPLVVDRDIPAMNIAQRSFKARSAKQSQDHTASFHSDTFPRARQRARHLVPIPQPPTLSMKVNATGGSSTTNGSKFTRMAKSLAREIEASQRWVSVPELENRSPAKSSRKDCIRRSPFRDVANCVHSRYGTSLPPKVAARSAIRNAEALFIPPSRQEPSQSKVLCLPDVTGLTSVVASPPKKDQKWRRYPGGSEGEQVEVELNKILTTLQTRLNQLESQNLVSRRRIQELEFELETCKLEVKRERTRVMEREEIIVAQQKDFQKRREAISRVPRNVPDLAIDAHYKEVIEEKKALESLVVSLRAHLSRLTNELSDHQVQLDDLRGLRQNDFLDLRAKIEEVDELRSEVERLAGEVDVLRGVVEEGLNERRIAKESMCLADNSKCQGEAANGISAADFPSPPPSRSHSPHNNYFNLQDKILSTELDAADSSRHNAPIRERHRSKGELGRRSAAVEDCPSDGPESHLSQDLDTHPIGQDNRHSRLPHNRFDGVCVRPEQELPVPARSRAKATSQPAKNGDVASPFPQIRGERLERLFFSAPAHNERTCRVCHRHRRPGASEDELDFPSWLPPRKRVKIARDEGLIRRQSDEVGDAEVSDNELPGAGPKVIKAPFSGDRLPPQTVLARVLRELEDDFTHYKGIYVELADQYKIMDAASNVAKRNVLAEHLKEVINTLEQKGDQIASLYDLLTFRDKPVKESIVPDRKRSSRMPRSPRAARQPFGRHHGVMRNRPTRP